jgi:uncharacterized membrane protein (UPF0127 family)
MEGRATVGTPGRTRAGPAGIPPPGCGVRHAADGGGRRCDARGVAWLLCDGRVLASLETADTRRARRRGLAGRDRLDGALLIRRCRSVHTFGMRVPLDVAFCDRDLVVLRITSVGRNRVTAPVLRAAAVVEAEAGSFQRWGVRPGDRLEVREGPA